MAEDFIGDFNTTTYAMHCYLIKNDITESEEVWKHKTQSEGGVGRDGINHLSHSSDGDWKYGESLHSIIVHFNIL